MATYRVTIKPERSTAHVLTIAQPSLRVTISKGISGAVLPRELVFGTAKVYGNFVEGYAVNGLPDTDTQAAIDYALSQGYPAWAIQWHYLGEQGDISIGSISAAAVSLQPVIAVPSIVGLQVGSMNAAAVSLTPSVTVGTLVGVQAGVGSIGAASVSLQPIIAAPSITGVQVGDISAASVSLRPVVSVGTLYSGNDAPVNVTLSPANGATIIYTVDGTDPVAYIVTDAGKATFDVNGDLITTGDVR